MRAEHPNVRHLAASFSGRAAARNAGIAAARGEVVLFNDADILASPDLLSTHLRRHRERRHVAIVGLEVQVKDMDEYRYKRDHPAARGHLHPPSRKKLSWLYFLTGNASVRRDDLVAAGCFDESFTGYGHEDLELGYRLQKNGVRILYEPDAVNYHCQAVPYEDQKAKDAARGAIDRALLSQASGFCGDAELGDDAGLAGLAFAADAAAVTCWAISTGARSARASRASSAAISLRIRHQGRARAR